MKTAEKLIILRENRNVNAKECRKRKNKGAYKNIEYQKIDNER